MLKINKTKFNKIITIILLVILSISPVFSLTAYATGHEESSGDEGDEYLYELETEDELVDPENDEDIVNSWEELDIPDSNIELQGSGLLIDETKIILNPSDRKDLKNIALLSSLVPDLYVDYEELSRLSGAEISAIEDLFANNIEEFVNLVKETEAEFFNNSYLKERLLTHPEILAEIFSTVPDAIIVRLQDPAEVRMMEKAIDSILEIQIDRRVIETLNYLVRPKDDPRGGAGHQRIKVHRIRRNYSREATMFSRESLEAEKSAREQNNNQEVQEEQTVELYRSESEDISQVEELLSDAGLDSEEPLVAGEITDQSGNALDDFLVIDDYETNISSHYTGQALSISEIDQIKCTLVKKRRIGSDKKTKQAPYNVRLKWQSNEGYSDDQAMLDSSFNEMFERNSLESIYAMLSELDIDLTNIGDMDLNIESFESIVAIVGQAFLSEALGLPAADLLQYDLSDMLYMLGGSMLADKFGLDSEPFQDTSINSIDALTQAIGRYSVEKKLNLPYSAMKGDSLNQVLIQIGKARMADELNIPLDALEFNIVTATTADIYKLIGSRVFEERYALPQGSFNQNTFAEAKAAANISMVNIVLAFPESVDQDLGLTLGTTERLKKGSLGLPDYLDKVTEAHLLKYGYTYQNYRSTEASGFSSSIHLPTGDLTNWRDEMHNTPEGSIDSFLSGNMSEDLFKNIAKDYIVKQLESTESQREAFRTWLDSPNSTFIANVNVDNEALPTPISAESYATMLGLTKTEFYQIFGTNSAGGVFKRLGESALYRAVENQTEVQERVQDIISSNASISEALQTYEFYSQRIDTIKNHLGSLNDSAEALGSALENSSAEDDESARGHSEQINQQIDSIQGFVRRLESTSNTSSILSITRDMLEIFDSTNGDLVSLSEIISRRRGGASSDLNRALNSFRYELEIVSKSAYEIITGNQHSDYRVGDLRLSQIAGNSRINLGGVSLSATDLVLFLSGQITPTEFLIMAGSAKLASEIGIPPKALYYITQVYEYIEQNKEEMALKDVFFRGIGLALLEDQLGISLSSLFQPETIGVKITVTQLRDKIAEQKRVSRGKANDILAESLNLKGFNLENLMRGDFGAWAQARARAETNDANLGLVAGTTEKFIKGEPLADFSEVLLGPNELAMFSGRLMISEASIKAFIAAKEGEENPAINQIYFVEDARYLNENNFGSNSSTSCSTDQVPNNVFLYYDHDGIHTFHSFAAANEYEQANQDKKLNYIDEIAGSLASYLVEQDQPDQNEEFEDDFGSDLYTSIKNSLTNFINDRNAKDAFEGVGLSIPMLLNDNFDIPTEVTEKIFERSESAEDDNVDFLYMSGYKIMNNLVGSYLNDYLGISIGGTRITADDIFQMFNGNPTDVFAQVGSRLLGEEMGVEAATISNIVMAESDEQRICLLNEAAAEIMGDIFGISGLNLQDLVSGNIGARRVEKVLNLPKNSFMGADLSELLGNTFSDQGPTNNLVPLSKFIEAFQIPESKKAHDYADNALKNISNQYYNSYKDSDLARKMITIENYLTALGTEAVNQNLELVNNWIKLVESVSESIRMIIGGAHDLYGNENLAIDTLSISEAYEGTDTDDLRNDWKRFLNRASNLDDIFGLADNTTLRLFQPPSNGAYAIISPDNYANLVEDNFLQNSLEEVAINQISELLGLSDRGIDTSDIRRFITAIRNIDSNNPFNPRNPTNPQGEIYDFLGQLFGLKLDKSAGFSDGTIRRIIENPENTTSILLHEGARKLDAQLGILDRNANFQTFIGVYLGETSIFDLCGDSGSGGFNACVNGQFIAGATDYVQETIINRASGYISNFLYDISGVRISATRTECHGLFCQEIATTTATYGISMPTSDIRGLFSGDFRPLMAIGAISGLGAVIGEERTSAADGTYYEFAVSEDMVITYDDVYHAVWGDRANQSDIDYARETAYASEMSRLEGGSTGWLENNDPGNRPSMAVSNDFGYGADGASRNISPTTIASQTGESAVSVGVRQDIDLAYPIPDGAAANAQLPDEPTEPNRADYPDDEEGYFQASEDYHANMTEWQNIRDT